VREADALHEAGFEVRVVSMIDNPRRCALDAELLRSRGWAFSGVNASRNRPAGWLTWFKAGARQTAFSVVPLVQRASRAAATAYSRYFPELAHAAAARPADLFKAHLLPALPAAWLAAKRWKAKLGFDAEDFHSGEFQHSPSTVEIVRRTQGIEQEYLRQCDHLTAASLGIADAYTQALNVQIDEVVLNAFSLAERLATIPREQLERERGPFAFSLYWFSATVGPDRGLIDALNALARLPNTVGLSIRGTFANGYRDKFLSDVKALSLNSQVRLLDPVPPQQLIRYAAEHDVGLALEPGDRINNRLATSNKLLAYLVAGIPVAASDVPGQAVVVRNLESAGFLYPPGDSRRLAEGLLKWVEYPDKLAEAKLAARRVAEEKYCWEIEKQKLVASVRSVFAAEDPLLFRPI